MAEEQKVFYRPDIDGLRALAIISVVLFHAGLGFPGGFVGVDVFFVISGFLISSLMLRELSTGKFSFAAFWERRTRRILPAATAAVVATLAAGWFWLFSEDYAALGRSVVAQSAMLANVYFFRHTDYFGPSSDTIPLLHTWSLAVEEQFYLVFPVLLALAFRFRRASVVPMVAVIAVGSLVMSVVGTRLFPTSTFFLLPTRAWELLTGTFLALYPFAWSRHRWGRECLAGLGLVLIAGSVFFYDHRTPFPGLAAIPPCLGAAAIIASSTSSALSTVGRVLALRPLVWIGIISYSLYLWHWPVLVFSKALASDFEGPTLFQKLGLLGLMLGLAVLSWRFVETPFRLKVLAPKRWQMFGFAIASAVVLIGAGAWINHRQGFRSRLPDRVIQLEETRKNIGFRSELTLKEALNGELVELGAGPKSEPPSVLLWGDSHAMAIASVIDAVCKTQGKRGVMATHSQTPPVLDFVPDTFWGLKKETPAYSQAIFDYVVKHRVKSIVLTAVWSAHIPTKDFGAHLVATVKRFVAAGVNVYVMKDVPMPEFDVPHLVAMTAFQGREIEQLGYSMDRHRKAEQGMETTFAEIQKAGGVVLDPAPYFLGPGNRFRVVNEGKVLYYDYGHLTPEGAALLSPLFLPILSGSIGK